MKLRVCLFCFCCFQHTFVESKTTKTFSEVKSVVFSSSKSKDVTNLGTLPQSRECRDVKKLYRNNGHIIIHHGTSINQLEKLFQTHFWVILVIINEVPPIQLTPPQNRVFEPLTVVRLPWSPRELGNHHRVE